MYILGYNSRRDANISWNGKTGRDPDRIRSPGLFSLETMQNHYKYIPDFHHMSGQPPGNGATVSEDGPGAAAGVSDTTAPGPPAGDAASVTAGAG